ncbi:putative membrane protein insertion efficiency factor [Alphaproteobacteria bacterium]|nr:putative membrane protein insertion efficiency factor [Alphaproteobacteria bacterium]GHT00720.1 putative membrane protein insertion efficiency factor [Alphaproteobacteria bacterium]
MIKKLILFLIRVYQGITSPFLRRCRFQPTCSHYTLKVIEAFGLKEGMKLAFKRMVRCRPSRGPFEKTVGKNWGYDPVPASKKQKNGSLKR